MTPGQLLRTAVRRPPPSTIGVTVFGCGADEAALFRELAPRYGVRPTVTAAPLGETNLGLAAGTRCVSVDHRTDVGNRALLALRRAGVDYISTRSIGSDHIDTPFARQIGLTVGNVVYSPDGVADYTLMLMLMAVRDARSTLRRADAQDFRLGETRGRELRDLTVGVVGTGRIGAAVLDRVRAFGSRVLAHDTRPKTTADHVPLDELLRRSDVVSLHTPLTSDTHHLLDRRRIALMKAGAILVNTGRGSLLDTEALVCALESGRLGGAALDVLEGEEHVFSADHRRTPIQSEPLLRLLRLPNVVISPHTAYYTDHALREIVESTLLSCVTFERRRTA